MEIVAGEQGLALQQLFISISGILKVAAHNFMKSRSRDGLAAKGLLAHKKTYVGSKKAF